MRLRFLIIVMDVFLMSLSCLLFVRSALSLLSMLPLSAGRHLQRTQSRLTRAKSGQAAAMNTYGSGERTAASHCCPITGTRFSMAVDAQPVEMPCCKNCVSVGGLKQVCSSGTSLYGIC